MNLTESELKIFLSEFVEYYGKAREQIGIPFNTEKFTELLENIKIEILDMKDTTGTFQVSQKQNFFKVIEKNFIKNGNARNIFLLLHEFTHLDSKFNANLPSTKDDLIKYENYGSIQKNPDLSSMDVYWGLIAIDEVLAQWCAEKCDKARKKETSNKSSKEKHSILGTEVEVETSFSDHDIYAPLEQFVESFAKKIGYKDMEEFAKSNITGTDLLYNKITNDNVEMLGYIGILCEGIYQENGFSNCGLPASDIPKALTYLNRIRKNDFPGSPSGGGNDR